LTFGSCVAIFDMSTMKCQAIYSTTGLNRASSCIRDGVRYCGIHDPERKKLRQERFDKQKEVTRETKFRLHLAYLNAKQRNTHG